MNVEKIENELQGSETEDWLIRALELLCKTKKENCKR